MHESSVQTTQDDDAPASGPAFDVDGFFDAVTTGRRLWRAVLALAVIGGCSFMVLLILVFNTQSEARSEARLNEQARMALQADVDRLSGQLAALTGDVTAATVRRQALIEQVAAAERDLARLTGEVEAQRKRRTEVNAGLDAARAELTGLQASIAAAAAQVQAKPEPHQAEQHRAEPPPKPEPAKPVHRRSGKPVPPAAAN